MKSGCCQVCHKPVETGVAIQGNLCAVEDGTIYGGWYGHAHLYENLINNQPTSAKDIIIFCFHPECLMQALKEHSNELKKTSSTNSNNRFQILKGKNEN